MNNLSNKTIIILCFLILGSSKGQRFAKESCYPELVDNLFTNATKLNQKAIAIYSYGGWSNRGHIEILSDDKTCEIKIAKPNTTNFIILKKEIPDCLKIFSKVYNNIISFTSEEHKSIAFDNLKFEVIYFNPKTNEQKQVVIDRPDYQKVPLLSAFIEDFYSLNP